MVRELDIISGSPTITMAASAGSRFEAQPAGARQTSARPQSAKSKSPGVEMDKFTTLEALPRRSMINVDTDMIIPKQYLKTIKRTGLGQGLFAEKRYRDDGSENPDFVLNKPAYRKAKILVADDNFGCGSSREHAPWALMDFGIRCVISTSFGDIFYNNCFKNGVLPIKVKPEDLEKLFDDAERGANATLSIDLEKQEIRGPDGGVVKFDIDPHRKHCLHGPTYRAHHLKTRSRLGRRRKPARPGVGNPTRHSFALLDRRRSTVRRAIRHAGFDHAAVELPALVAVLRQLEGGDVFRAWATSSAAKGGVATDLVGMDEVLPSNPCRALRRIHGRALGVAEVVVDAVENVDPVDADRGHALHQPRNHRGAPGHDARARLLGEVVGAHHEGGEPRFRVARAASAKC
jgi:3-isopropylmalate/(R)-2-methylmalate dehydratase small subunit